MKEDKEFEDALNEDVLKLIFDGRDILTIRAVALNCYKAGILKGMDKALQALNLDNKTTNPNLNGDNI